MINNIANYVEEWHSSPFAGLNGPAWQITGNAEQIVSKAIDRLHSEYRVSGVKNEIIAIHCSAVVETGAVIKGPAILGPETFVAAGAYLRGGVFLGSNCIVGPACELKSTLMFPESKIAHLSFVGDSIIGSRVNIEAGAIVANYRNELMDKQIRFIRDGQVINTGVEKFGALISDDVRIGANAVVAPGAILEPGFCLTRLGIIDQHPERLR